MKKLLIAAFLLMPAVLFAGEASTLEEAKKMASENNKLVLVDLYQPN